MFNSENWPDALCHSAVWLPIWLSLLCIDWPGCSPLLWKIALALIFRRADPLLGCHWNMQCCSRWKLERCLEQLRLAPATVTLPELWSNCDWSGSLFFCISHHHPLHLRMWKSVNRLVMWTWYDMFCTHVNMAQGLWHTYWCVHGLQRC